MGAKHAIIVGAGIGGLTAALELAAKEWRVTVLEAHDTIGGKMRQITFPGHAGIDSGPTVFTMRWVFDDLARDLDIDLDAHLTLRPLQCLARHGWPDAHRLDLFADIEQSVDAIGRFAGAKDAEAYRRFCKTAATVFNTLDHTFMRASQPNPIELTRRIALQNPFGLTAIHPFQTLWQSLCGTFRDPRLRQLFGRYATYTGGSPFQSPATLMLIAHAERCGVWMADGGVHAVAQTFAKLATERGADVRCGTAVTAIGTTPDGRHATGVTLATGEVIDADAVVYNGDISALGIGRLGVQVGDTHKRDTVAPADRSQSAMTWSAIAHVSDDFAAHTVAFSDDYEAEFDATFRRRALPNRPTVYAYAPDRGAHETASSGTPVSRGTNTPERIFLLTNAPANGDVAAYPDGAVTAAENAARRTLSDCGLDVSWSAEQVVTTTPADFARMFPGTGGALYGRAPHGWQSSFARATNRSSIAGLYLCGGSVHPGPGVPMAFTSGRLAAAAVVQGAH